MSGAETQKEMTVAWTRAVAVEVIRREVRGVEESTLTLHEASGHSLSLGISKRSKMMMQEPQGVPRAFRGWVPS